MLLAGCGGSATEPSATKTVTVQASPTEATPSDELADSPAVPEPDANDFRAVAIYTIQTESRSYSGASDGLVKNLLDLTCSGLLATDGKHVDDFGFEMGEVALDSAGVPRSEYPLFIRAATAFCPQALDEVAARYGAAG